MRALLSGLFIVAMLSIAHADPVEDGAWEMAKGSADPGVLEMFLQRYPDGPYAADARAKLDALDDAGTAFTAPPPPAPAAPPPPAVDYALLAQGELKRAGCYSGALDGDWGKGGRSALDRFAKRARVSIANGYPDASTLALLRATPGTVCVEVASDPECLAAVNSACRASYLNAPLVPPACNSAIERTRLCEGWSAYESFEQNSATREVMYDCAYDIQLSCDRGTSTGVVCKSLDAAIYICGFQ